ASPRRSARSTALSRTSSFRIRLPPSSPFFPYTRSSDLSPNQPYDMHEVIRAVVDDEDFLEVQELFAPNIIVGFGRVEGSPVGVRSEEHTSELQSRENLVCRLLLEKKKNPRTNSSNAKTS